MLKISNFSVSLDDKKILNNINLILSSGETSVLMGPNGSGKSTLATSIMGHPSFKIDSGNCLFNGINLLDLNVENRARSGLFLAAQNSISIPGVQVFTFLRESYRMLKNLEVDISVNDFKIAVIDVFKMVGLHENFLFRNLNDGFSGGEKKRFEIAQMLLFEPKIVILDEIDSGLDSDALKLLANALNYIKKRKPDIMILLITHYSRLIDYINPDKVYVLHNGQIIKSGDKTLAKEIELSGYEKFI